jgi:hypothetical protein
MSDSESAGRGRDPQSPDIHFHVGLEDPDDATGAHPTDDVDREAVVRAR